jgi:hypothetical protein
MQLFQLLENDDMGDRFRIKFETWLEALDSLS